MPMASPGSRIFLSQIPFNYYCILTLVMVIVTSLLNIDYGPMLTHEYNAQVKDDLFLPRASFGGDDYEEGAKHSSRAGSAAAVIVLIALCIVGLVWTGGMWDAESDNYGNFVMSFSDASAGADLCGFHHCTGLYVHVLLAAASSPSRSPWMRSPMASSDDLPHPDPLLRLDPVRVP
ncbi:MAG: hypothetical protein ACLTGT_07280 [Oscillospiraceae bacterium]